MNSQNTRQTAALQTTDSAPNRTSQWHVTCSDTYDFHKPEFAELLSACDATGFQERGWLVPFFRILPSFLALKPVIVCVRDEKNHLKMLLPCVRRTVWGIHLVQPADLGLTDYNCPLVHPDAIDVIQGNEDLQDRIFRALRPCDIFFFQKQRADKIGIETVLRGASTSPSEVQAHQVDLFAPYDAWAKNKLSQNFRTNTRAKFRKLGKICENLSFDTVVEPSEITDALRFIQAHRGQRYKNDILQNHAVFGFYSEVAREGAQSGFAQTFVMRVDGEIVAAFFGLNWDDVHCYLLGAFKPGTLERFSIGLQTLTALIADRIEANVGTFDFGLGDEPYKKRFQAEEVKMHHAVYALSPFGKIIALTYEKAKPLKRVLVKTIFRLR